MKKVAIWVVFLVIAAVCAVQYKGYRKDRAAAEKVEQEKQTKDAKIKALQKHIVAVLKDPSSVQWQGEFLSSDQTTLCGEVNAKNSLGGYVGFKRYIANNHGYLIEGGVFSSWSMEHNKIPVPDYMEDGARRSDAGDQATFSRDVFEFFWTSNCKEG